MAKKRKWLKRIGKAALAAGAAYAGSKFLASQKPGWGVKEGFTDMDKNVGKTTDRITKKRLYYLKRNPMFLLSGILLKKIFGTKK